ncbi:MAG TPA: hypothetical protein VGC62_07915 [Pseudomonas sp.]|uniref:hypothetical protein n=1 Tax=Pseudomonas sp. TaxID=306 RepID=UPI002EDB7F33
MKTVALSVMCCVVLLAGCSGSNAHHKACEVLVPASINVPTTENQQRVEAQATGEPGGDRNQEQNCP